MLPILGSSDEVQNNLFVFILNSPDLAEKRKALTLLGIFLEEIRIIIKIIIEGFQPKGRKHCLTSSPPPKLKNTFISAL